MAVEAMDETELVAVTFLDRDVGAVSAGKVERRARRGDEERDAVVGAGQRLEIGADLVGNVAVGGDAVGADDDGIDLAGAHEQAGSVVGDQRVRHTVLFQLPGRKEALVARTGFGHPDMHRHAGIVRGVDRRQRRAVVDGGQPAGVAVGHHVQRLAVGNDQLVPQLESVLADGCVLGNVLLGDGSSFGPGSGAALLGRQRSKHAFHTGQRPVQVDGGRPRRAEDGDGFGQPGVGSFEIEGDGQSVGCRGADQGRTAHLHGADGVRRFVERGDANPVQRVWQTGLVDDVDGAPFRMGAQGAGGDAVDVHGSEWFGVGAQPGGVIAFADFPGSQRKHGQSGVLRGGGQAVAVQAQVHTGTEKACALVAVNEWMIFGEAEGIGGGAVKQVGAAVVKQVFRAGQRRIEQAFISDSLRSTMYDQALAVQEQQGPPVDPDEHATWRVRGRCRGTRA